MNLRDKVMSLYLGLSFSVGIVVLSFLEVSFSEILLNYPLSALFSFLPAYIFINQKSNLSYLSMLRSIEFFLFAHFSLLVGMSAELAHIGAHYMSVVPALFLLGQILNNWTLSSKEKGDRLVLNFSAILFVFSLPFFFSSTIVRDQLSIVFLITFFAWQVGALFFAHFQLSGVVKNLSTIFSRSLRVTRQSVESSDHPLLKDRYFFHDLINHTHAMDLTLRYKLMKSEGLSHQQTRELSEQLQLLQSLVKEHFGFAHKNLNHSDEGGSFERLFFINDTLINAFLPQGKVRTFITIKDELELKTKVTLPLARWQRILTNLIKNASEARCSTFELYFIFKADGLVIEAKNDFFQLNHKDGELGSGLANVIKNMDSSMDNGPGLGLEAIQLLANEFDGTFNFSIQDGLWSSRVELRYSLVDDKGSEYKLLNSNKKAS